MYPYDIIKVKYFQMLGDSPEPDRDVLLGECDVRIWEQTVHGLRLELPVGQYRIYTVGIDRFGNIIYPMPRQIVSFEVTE